MPNLDGTSLTNAASVGVSGLPGAVIPTRWVGGTTSGPPAGSFLLGDFSIDSNGIFWICIAAPSTWRSSTNISTTLVGDGTTTDIPVYHALNLSPRDACVVQCINQTTFDYEIIRWSAADVNTVVIHFSTAPTTGAYRAVVVGASGTTARSAYNGGSASSVSTWTIDGGVAVPSITSTISGGSA